MSEHENKRHKVEIVQHGRMYDRKVVFECSCGCIFRAQPEGRVFRDTLWWYAAHCPECWTVARVEDKETTDLDD